MPCSSLANSGKDPETGKYIMLLTIQMKWGPETVAVVYKDRWQIEIFFKMIKQNLKIKSFPGTSRNTILSQICVAMIAYLLLAYKKFISTYKWTINTWIKILTTLLFSRCSLWERLNCPFDQPPPKSIKSLQLELI